jgi:hypothetical protein
MEHHPSRSRDNGSRWGEFKSRGGSFTFTRHSRKDRAMAYEIRENSGSLFVNDKKSSDKHPDRKGQALIGGVEYWVSAWRKKSAVGKDFVSLAFTPKEEANGNTAQPVAAGFDPADIPEF